jgi:hypothetical protein
MLYELFIIIINIMECIYSRKNKSDDLQTISFDSVTDEIVEEDKEDKEDTDLTYSHNIFSKYICCLFYKNTKIKRQE